jgi:thymidylate kinase
LINFSSDEESLAMETYQTWARLFELEKYYSWIIDRFHISTRAYQLQERNVDYDFRWLEDRLYPLGFRLVFMTRTNDSFAAAREERIKVSGKPDQYDDLSIFIREQELMRQLVSDSMLPVLRVDISDDNVSNAVGTIADWLETTGGLYLES